MKKDLLAKLPLLVLATLFIGCASSYQNIKLYTANYSSPKLVGDSVKVAYATDVQKTSGNTRYARKEKQRQMYAVAVRIQNLSSAPIAITRENFRIVDNQGKEKVVYTPQEYAKKVKQHVGGYLLHTLWGPWGVRWEQDTYTGTHVTVYYLPVGMIVGVGNAVKAGKANKKNLASIINFEPWDRIIPPGKSLEGVVALAGKDSDSLQFKFENRSPINSNYRLEAQNYALANSTTHDFFVTLSDGLSFRTKTKIDISGSEHTITVTKPDKTVVVLKPEDTKTLSRVINSKQVLAIPGDGQWMFRVISGSINGYFFIAEDEPKYLSAIQKNNGEIIPFSKQALIDMVQGNAKALVLISEDRYIEAVNAFNAFKDVVK